MYLFSWEEVQIWFKSLIVYQKQMKKVHYRKEMRILYHCDLFI